MLLILSCTPKDWKSFLTLIIHSFSNLVVEDDEDDFPTVRPDGDFVHNSNSSKEKCKCVSVFSLMKIKMISIMLSLIQDRYFMLFSKQKMARIIF